MFTEPDTCKTTSNLPSLQTDIAQWPWNSALPILIRYGKHQPETSDATSVQGLTKGFIVEALLPNICARLLATMLLVVTKML